MTINPLPQGGQPDCWRFRRARPVPKGVKTLIMGIVNMTPDSFSGLNSARTPADGAKLALSLLASGADVVDIGAESTRPGAETLSAEEEISRLGDTVARLRDLTAAPIAVDTYHRETAELVLRQGADIINDVTALRGGWGRADRHNTAMASLAAAEGAHVILMHMPEPPDTMQSSPEYDDVVAAVREFLTERAELAERAGIPRDNIWLDPGFGFGKTFRHNRELLLRLVAFSEAGYPVAVGLSRKRMIADALGLLPEERLEASLALAVIASLTGADMVRVHDVKETARAVGMSDAVRCEE